MGQEIFPVMRGGAGMEQEKSIRGGGEDPILRPRPAPLPSLTVVSPISVTGYGVSESILETPFSFEEKGDKIE